MGTAASLAVSSPTAFFRRWPATYSRGLPALGFRCLLGVSHALKALIRPPSPGHVSDRSRPWGSPSRAFPPADPPSLSAGRALLWLAPRNEFPDRMSHVASTWASARQRQPVCSGLGPGSPHFRVLIPADVRFALRICYSVRRIEPSWAFSSLGVSPLSPAGSAQEPFPLSGFFQRHHAPLAGPSGSCQRKNRLGFFKPAAPFEVHHLVGRT